MKKQTKEQELYYLRHNIYNNTCELWKRNDIKEGIDGLIATFTSEIHADIAMQTFNNL